MKCNLDCSYCDSEHLGGHNNSLPHPPVDECLKTIDFMFEYADRQMALKPAGLKHVILNVYGGEALHHPNIIEILNEVKNRYQQYQSRWHLVVTTTTNAIITPRRLEKIIPLIDEFTVSYHTENTPKQKQQFRDNLLRIQQANRRLKCIVLVHPEPENFQDVNQMIDWLKENNIRHLPRQLDHGTRDIQFNYRSQQVKWFKKLYQEKSHNVEVKFKEVIDNDGRADLAETGRACCGGRQLCSDQNYKQRNFFVNNTFTDWYCSVDKFFLYIKQVDNEVYVNKDCGINYQNQNGPIGSLKNTQLLLEQIGKTPIIKCINKRCFCGLCAPKAVDLDTYNSIMKKYQL